MYASVPTVPNNKYRTLQVKKNFQTKIKNLTFLQIKRYTYFDQFFFTTSFKINQTVELCFSVVDGFPSPPTCGNYELHSCRKFLISSGATPTYFKVTKETGDAYSYHQFDDDVCVNNPIFTSKITNDKTYTKVPAHQNNVYRLLEVKKNILKKILPSNFLNRLKKLPRLLIPFSTQRHS